MKKLTVRKLTDDLIKSSNEFHLTSRKWPCHLIKYNRMDEYCEQTDTNSCFYDVERMFHIIFEYNNNEHSQHLFFNTKYSIKHLQTMWFEYAKQNKITIMPDVINITDPERKDLVHQIDHFLTQYEPQEEVCWCPILNSRCCKEICNYYIK